MRIEIITIPRGYGLGDPPQRLAERIFVYPGRTGVLASGPAREIVFDDLATLRAALRTIEKPHLAVPDATFATWHREQKETGQRPCLECRSTHPEALEHCPKGRPAKAVAKAKPSMRERVTALLRSGEPK